MGFMDEWLVTYNDNEFSLARSKALESALVSQCDLARLHDQGKLGIDGISGLLCFLEDS
jgi:hypothetical protein